MQKHQFTLYHYWRSSCSWRIRWALNYKGLTYKSVSINLLKNEHTTPEFLKKSPSGYIPCLTINGQSATESIAILEWLEEVYPLPALLPSSSEDRLAVRRLVQTISSGIQPIQNLAVLQFVKKDPAERPEFARYWIDKGLKVYEQLIRHSAGTYSLGSQISLADLCLIPQVYNAYRYGVDMKALPLVDRIYHNALATPACQAALPENQADAIKTGP